MGENHKGPELVLLPPLAGGLSMEPKECVQGADGGDDSVCLQAAMWGSGLCAVKVTTLVSCLPCWSL